MHAIGNYTEHAKAQMVCTLSLTASVAFITQRLNYVDALFEELHEYFSPKEGVGNGMKGDRGSICSDVLWASFRTLLDVAQIYLDFNFENHPAMLSECIQFLATNSGFE